EERLKNIEEELKVLQPPQEIVDMGAGREAFTELEDRSDIQDMDIDMLGEEVEETLQTSLHMELTRLQITRHYYTDAVRFIHQIYTAIPMLCQLLVFMIKSEVLEAIDFFVTAYTYKMEFAREGLKKILHLIWTKDNNNKRKGIQKRLIESYRKLHAFWNKTKALHQHFSLTFNATLAELTSLEQLLTVSKKEILKTQRHGAIIVLSMLAKAKMEIVQEKIDLLLKIGLGSFEKADFSLAKYTCIVLQCLDGSKTKVKGSLNNDSIQLPMSHQIFHRLKQMIEIQTTLQEW
ncbi:802_t:CDS:2, partial [Acaulospora morrowiae]